MFTTKNSGVFVLPMLRKRRKKHVVMSPKWWVCFLSTAKRCKKNYIKLISKVTKASEKSSKLVDSSIAQFLQNGWIFKKMKTDWSSNLNCCKSHRTDCFFFRLTRSVPKGVIGAGCDHVLKTSWPCHITQLEKSEISSLIESPTAPQCELGKGAKEESPHIWATISRCHGCSMWNFHC